MSQPSSCPDAHRDAVCVRVCVCVGRWGGEAFSNVVPNMSRRKDNSRLHIHDAVLG